MSMRRSSLLLPRFARLFSASSSHVVVEKAGPIATLRMARPPVNSLNLEHLTELANALKTLETDKEVKAVVLSSASPKIFSAGLDITEERMTKFWTALQEVWLRLYGFKKPVGAAIVGHSPAGGCLLAMSCDVRVMASGPFKIGLNETQLGIVAPPWFADVMNATVGHRHTERLLQLGALLDADKALAIGLVDRVEPLEQVEEAVVEELTALIKIPSQARHASKMLLRDPILHKLNAARQADTEDFVSFVSTPKAQGMLGAYLESLKKKK